LVGGEVLGCFRCISEGLLHSLKGYLNAENKKMQEKVAKSLIPHEHTLHGSHYGKYFAKKVNLHLLQRKPDEWRNIQSQSQNTQDRSFEQLDTRDRRSLPDARDSRKRKRTEIVDEIDVVFENAFRGRRVRGSLIESGRARAGATNDSHTDNMLQGVLGAIKEAPG
jgi:nucleolar protein 9